VHVGGPPPQIVYVDTDLAALDRLAQQ